MSAQVLDRAAHARGRVRRAARHSGEPVADPGRPALALALLGLIAAAGGAWYGWDWWRVGRFVETTDDAYVGGNVTTLSPHVAGFVAQILVG